MDIRKQTLNEITTNEICPFTAVQNWAALDLYFDSSSTMIDRQQEVRNSN